jgi:hypothetical protein
VGFTMDWYVNLGHAPATIESLSLVDPHGLVLHGGLVYEMYQAKNPLGYFGAWNHISTGVPPGAWQPIPGGVIPTGHTAQVMSHVSAADNLYVIVEKVTATSDDGGWAAGLTVNYTADGGSYSTTGITGIAIGSSQVPQPARCNSQLAAIKSDFQLRGVHPSTIFTGYVT